MSMPTPGMAGQNSLHGEVTAFYQPMLFQRFHAVLRTGRCIPALIAKQRRNTPLVNPDNPYERVAQQAEDLHDAASASFASFFKIREILCWRVVKGAIFLSV